MKNKMILTIVLITLAALGGYMERGWFDFLGLAAMLTLGVPMLITWQRIDREAKKRPDEKAS